MMLTIFSMLTCSTAMNVDNIRTVVMVTVVCVVMSGIQNDLWARFVTLPNQDRIWTLTLTNKAVHKETAPGIGLLSVFLFYCHIHYML